ncbi:MAG: polysaccharide deacetylase family protein, partial [Armatimonadota bacterium]|nr:polysaccharide deacetylase family protein [Armatimonadota bacterium]
MNDPVYRVDTEEQVVYLTFDDGPYAETDVTVGRATATTGELLDQLAALRATVGDPALSATFFVNGWAFVKPTPDRNAPDQPDDPVPAARRAVARRLLAEGHDLANHSQHHLNPWG